MERTGPETLPVDASGLHRLLVQAILRLLLEWTSLYPVAHPACLLVFDLVGQTSSMCLVCISRRRRRDYKRKSLTRIRGRKQEVFQPLGTKDRMVPANKTYLQQKVSRFVLRSAGLTSTVSIHSEPSTDCAALKRLRLGTARRLQYSEA